ncbi:TPA: DUF2827 domain-containing protein [Burkholderia vietnamiensis]|uniref:DUF2827 domain-containing protein n=1 Tax=Burkholderia vietnamiensis TaxID=60552 RepID=UPI001CB3B944|nr:DUF2827 domain-containing protein [Burkholderia vietnamiensis]CAG9200633.1 conserved hypothetical protein [Burkholderia vietnamiensis]HDR9055959.1 DUF2827 domain-containing protein [Burkholderia vietnamiensis]HDR9157055.1 DUF2827 domain-containing protein [Burkholderia vietnamiensis]
MNGERLNVGVTIYLRNGHQSIWENGIFQNCYFVAMLLQHAPNVDSVYLVNGGDGDPASAAGFLEFAPVPVIDLDTARHKTDVVIELSAQLNPDWARAFREKGGRVVGMRVANDYVIDIERMMFGLPHGMLVSGTPYSAIWTLPAFEKTCAGYYEAALRAPVTAMQHLWSPALVERAANGAFGYRPARPRWRVAVLEPNICMVKTSHIPMLIADLAHRQQPDLIEFLRVFNTVHLKDDAQFVGFARSLDLVLQGRATFEPRLPIRDVLTQQADAIVSHSWENAQNYVYYEALHGGYPLVHNSDYLGGCGYRYADFDCEGGALALREAFAVHDASLASYNAKAREFLATLDPLAPANVAQYAAALAAVVRD